MPRKRLLNECKTISDFCLKLLTNIASVDETYRRNLKGGKAKNNSANLKPKIGFFNELKEKVYDAVRLEFPEIVDEQETWP